ncbi:MAG TPA: hypothetical protein PK156_14405 [Polyangium sp.]|nr:hypothetical protein [Polyangium sp.]
MSRAGILLSLAVVGSGCDGNVAANRSEAGKKELTRSTDDKKEVIGSVGDDKNAMKSIDEPMGVLVNDVDGPAKSAVEQKREAAANQGSLGEAARDTDLGNTAGLINAGTYAFAASTGATLEDMSSGTTLIVVADVDDNASAVAPIGFDFWYDGTRHTLFSANANGLMRLGTAGVSTEWVNGLTTLANMPQIAPYWDDLRVGNNGKIHYKIVGSAPNRKLVVEWMNSQIPRGTAANAPGAGTFQAWLWESTGVIEFVYGSGIVANTANSGYSVGLGTSAASFASVTTSTNTVSYTTANNTQIEAIPAGTKYTFTPNVPTANPGALSFTAVGLNGMTLNWTDGSTNEVGYAIYRSLDGVNYEFVRQTAANTTSSAETGLASDTTWYWKVATVTEGGVSAASSGNQPTTTGTVSGTMLVGPTGMFPTLTAALANIATNGLAGNVTIELESTYTSAGETFPITFGSFGSPSRTVTIRPTTGATNLTITSGNATATLDLDGATNVIIDGRAGGTGPSQLKIENTATAGNAVRFINGASRNTVQYATINGVNNSTTSGVVLFGVAGSNTTGNNNNTIDHCDIGDGATTPNNAIISTGSTTGGQLNTGNVISNNNIFNFFNATSGTAGILVNTNTAVSSTGWTITNNRIFQTAPRTYTTGNTHRGILVNGGNNYTVNGNVVGFANAAGTGTYTMTGTVTSSFLGIRLQAGPIGNTIQNNTVAGISLGTNSTGTLSCISLTSGGASITGNTVGSGTGNGSITLNIAGASGGSFIAGVAVGGAGAGEVVVSNNTIGSLTGTGSGTLNTNINAAELVGGMVTFTNNTVGSTTTANSIQITSTGAATSGQQVIGALVGLTMPTTISNNTFANLTNAGTGTAHLIRGLQYQGTGTGTISLNTVHDISSANANTSVAGGGTAVGGILYTGTSTYGASVTQNTVYALSATNTGAVSTTVSGIAYSNPTNGMVTRNTIYDLRNASTGTTATAPPRVIGILIRAALGTGMSASNNMISIGNTTTNTEFVGIMQSFSTNLVNLSYNSVHIGGTAATGSLPSYGFLRGDDTAASAITTPVSVLNNIFNNVRAGGTGKHYAIGNVNTTPTMGWSVAASNNNVLNSPSTATVGIWGLTTDQTFAQWQTSSASDGASFSGVPVTFTNAATGDLHFNCGTTGTFIESHGVAIPGLTIDYDNQTRPGPTGSVNGGATAPDIGADEADCVPSCLADTDCNDGNPCTTNTCNVMTNTCVYAPVVCAALDQCHVAGTCDMATGMCSNPNASDGTTCSDSNACTQADTCQAGACVGANPVTCMAMDQCHVAGTCDTATGQCDNPAAADGTTCSDGNGCTQTDTCQTGACVGANPVTCMALDQCHVAGICDTATGMCSNPNANDGTACSDNNACTQSDTCQMGTCTGANPVTCTAMDQCHVAGTCDTATGQCDNPAAADGTTCSDGNGCTQTDTCQMGSCTGANPVTCVAQDQCHVAGTCDTATGQCDNPTVADGTACNDSDACTQMDTCQTGTCTGANPITCAAMDQCHVVGVCDPMTGTCSNPTATDGSTCDDGNMCTQMDSCQGGTCTGMNPVVCTALDECHDVGTCLTTTGVCDDPVKADGAPCTNGMCQGGTCTMGTGGSGGAGGSAGAGGAGGSAGAGGAGGGSSSSGGAGGTGGAAGEGGSGGSGDGPPIVEGGCECNVPAGTTNSSTVGALLGALGLLAFRSRRRRP